MITDYLRSTDSAFLGLVVMGFFLGTANISRQKELSYWIRKVISLSQPNDPLKLGKAVRPKIDVAIPCHVKDFQNLPFVINGAVATVSNPIGSIKLVTPGAYADELRARFPECQVLEDEQVLGSELMDLIAQMVPPGARGWVTQQVLKYRVALSSAEVGTLILDADTVLLRPRVWVDSRNVQILCVANEYHAPYKQHQRRVFGGRSSLLSFVTHHQLMKTEALKQMFGSNGHGLVNWLNAADFSEDSALSEFDTYGEWMVLRKPNEICFAKWNNLPIKISPDKETYEQMRARLGSCHSVSNHTYL